MEAVVAALNQRLSVIEGRTIESLLLRLKQVCVNVFLSVWVFFFCLCGCVRAYVRSCTGVCVRVRCGVCVCVCVYLREC